MEKQGRRVFSRAPKATKFERNATKHFSARRGALRGAQRPSRVSGLGGFAPHNAPRSASPTGLHTENMIK